MTIAGKEMARDIKIRLASLRLAKTPSDNVLQAMMSRAEAAQVWAKGMSNLKLFMSVSRPLQSGTFEVDGVEKFAVIDVVDKRKRRSAHCQLSYLKSGAQRLKK